jgi:hypothetical protein
MGNIMELAEQYMETTRPSERKKQGANNLIDIMVRIRDFQILQLATVKKFKK